MTRSRPDRAIGWYRDPAAPGGHRYWDGQHASDTDADGLEHVDSVGADPVEAMDAVQPSPAPDPDGPTA
jgi:hypothetical protein